MIAVMGPREPDERERGEWEAEFEAAARRPLKTRLRYAFIHTHMPVLDDAPYRETLPRLRAFLEYWRRTAR